MRWREKRTAVVENAATVILEALKEQTAEHHLVVAAVRKRLKEGEERG